MLHALKSFTGCEALHIHHALMPQADDWAKHCQKICDELNIPFHQINLKLTLKKGDSIEAVARTTRLNAFKDFLKEDDVLLLAHHASDQAETFLLQLMRGAGPKGLSCMPSIKPLGKGFCARPLLDISKEAIKKYADSKKLHWVDDPSNQDKNFARNFLRAEVLPILTKINPSVGHCISRSANHCAQSQQLLMSLLKEAYDSCVKENKFPTATNLSSQ